MNTKLTLRMDESLVETAKEEAASRGKSVSQMVGDFFGSLKSTAHSKRNRPPITASLLGVLRNRKLSEADYKKHLREKYR
ncbi:MAG TPA: DUF6364 family protein [Kiritimatiellia bacterium]|nr:DUF6364 family protein [Kiritimatiellia bacterium]HPA79074.1 DUF6364 family protein [Kiritimatiellia bacterium]